MSRPLLLDLFCGGGGAAEGYRRAGFDVIDVDNRPQPHYPFRFVQADAVALVVFLAEGGHVPGTGLFAEDFAAIHASPPCQKFTAYRRRGAGVGDGYPDLVALVREQLERCGVPWVIENVPGSPVHPQVQLCGSSFGLDVRRHRWFESSVPMMSPPCAHGLQKPRFAHATNRSNLRRTVEIGVWRIPLAVQQQAMGIDWMTLEELTEAIPPAYTEYIGGCLIDAARERDAA
jgi:DNA (cytosine-5)-methyltransferase 1